MDQQNHGLQPQGPAGRRLHIAHRRTPSEMTPLMMEQLALQAQIEHLQQQQQQIAATHQQYVNLGMIPPQQQLPGGGQFQGNPMQAQMQGMSPQPNAFQFPQGYQQQQQQMAMQMNPTPQPGPSHRRNQSALPNMGMGQIGGPPPAPSSGLSGSAFSDFNQQQSRENQPPRNNRAAPPGAGHNRRHSLALPEAKKAAELAEQKRKTSGFQFPIPGSAGAGATSPAQPPSPGPTETTPTSQGAPGPRTMSRGSAHGRSQSMAVGGGRGMMRGGASAFQFPPNAAESTTINNTANTSGLQRSGSGSGGHGRTGSRNFDGNWRSQAQGQQAGQEQAAMNMANFASNQPASNFQPGHRNRGQMSQSVSSFTNFQYPGQQPMMQIPQGQMLVQPPSIYPGQGLNPLQLAQLQALQTAQASGQSIPGLQMSQHAPGQMMGGQQQQQQQRKTLFTPYLPQATLPALLGDGQLVAGVLRVNKKNRSDAYVTTTDLDADIFICGSKDRNRALEGDLVAVELLDVDEVWGQKREKEEKKKRKDVSDNRGNNTSANDATTGGDTGSATEGGLRRRGSLRQRPTQKKNDDVEVEGQSLLLMEEEEINDEQKPLYAGHIVAVVERVAGQMFSGTLGLLRPSSQATKEKQEAERQTHGGGRSQFDRQQEKPKIVWFKPTDKRVPLIAIPTEQAPRDFVERHQNYANVIFVACIKRWPITSLHPFGTLVENLGEMGNLKVETNALLRDNNFGPDEFSDAVVRSVGFADWSVEKDGDSELKHRRDFRSEQTFTIDPNGAEELDDALHFKDLDDGTIEVGMHVADIAHFVKANSLVDREAKKRGTGVYLINRTVNMLPPALSSDICCLSPDQDRYTVSVVFKIDAQSGEVLEDQTWLGKAIIKSSGKLSYDEVDSILAGHGDAGLTKARADQVRRLSNIVQKLQRGRYGNRSENVSSLRLLYQLDDENVPVENNIFNSSPAHELVEELEHRANAFVAQRIYQSFGEKAWLRRQAPPNPRRLQTFAERMTNIGYDIDVSSSGELQNSVFGIDDPSLRKGMETLLVKAMQRAKYCLPGKTPEDELGHYALNLPFYTHFTNPSRRYADIVVHRQVEALLADDLSMFQEDVDSLLKTAELCNTKKDSAQAAQEQSVHIESCRKIDKIRESQGGDLVCEGIVLCVYESAFDVLIPEYGFEKRVHCDQLPLKKAEFDKNKRVLELYWEKGVPSSTYVPEDERSKGGSIHQSASFRRNDSSRRENQEKEEARRRQIETGTISTDDTDALFNDDDDSEIGSLSETTAGVSLGNSSHAPSPPTTAGASVISESQNPKKDEYLKWMTVRETGGENIQYVTEMTRVPVILKTDLTKSPPCLTIRSVNPFAL